VNTTRKLKTGSASILIGVFLLVMGVFLIIFTPTLVDSGNKLATEQAKLDCQIADDTCWSKAFASVPNGLVLVIGGGLGIL